jgi:hypothetical protein
MKWGSIALAGSLVAAASGCDVTESDPAICDAAAEHVAACEGAPDVSRNGCDPDTARALLDTPCEMLTNPSKSDILGSLLCSFGLLRYCDVPACDAALGFDHDFASMDCAELIGLEGCGACDYYRCRDAQSTGQCGDEGYYLGFGHRYCLRYRQVTEPRLSAQGQRWSAQTRQCLMEILEADIEDTPDCAALREAGYDSHLDCYADSGFCDLSLSDRQLLFSTVDREDRDYDLMKQILGDCLTG